MQLNSLIKQGRLSLADAKKYVENREVLKASLQFKDNMKLLIKTLEEEIEDIEITNF